MNEEEKQELETLRAEKKFDSLNLQFLEHQHLIQLEMLSQSCV